MREWRGSVFLPKGRTKLYLKVWDGGWRNRATPYPDTPEGRRRAEELLADLRSELLARHAAMAGEAGPVTVRAWAKRWLEDRTTSHGDDEAHLRLHILPDLGDQLLADVEPRHVLEMARGWEGAPRSIRNRYSTAHAMFRDAAVAGLIKSNPCILSRPAHLPPIEDGDAEWRSSAVLKRAEIERILGTPEIEEDSRVVYALLALAALRHGELSALRWRHYDPDMEPLGRLIVANSNRRRRTKAGRTRWMPVLPLLASTLARWRLEGWARLMGRPPTDEDLILPLPAEGARGARPHLLERDLRMRTKDHTWKRWDRHLETLGMRHRRVHDLRRTFLSLAEADGADRTVLGWGTHGRAGDILSAYTEPDWRRLCAEVSKLRIRPARPRVVTPLVSERPSNTHRRASEAAKSVKRGRR